METAQTFGGFFDVGLPLRPELVEEIWDGWLERPEGRDWLESPEGRG